MKLLKKEQVKNILELGSSNTENYNNKQFYAYLQKNGDTYTYYISHTSDTKRYV